MKLQRKTKKLHFGGVSGRDVYNITAPFQYGGETVIAGRVEKREDERSEIVFFREEGDAWMPMPGAPIFSGVQDPRITRINGRLLLGGVRFPVRVGDDFNAWQMEFYFENEDGSFELIFTGPPKMKDICFVQLESGQVVCLTRPQGEKGGRGKIGYFVAESFADALDVQAIEDAPLLEGLCPEEEWVGANDVYPLSNHRVGVLAHIANYCAKHHKHYYAIAFVLDLKSGAATPPAIIARREDFPEGESKQPDLEDIIFAGGLVPLGDGRANLYAGLGDAEAGVLEIDDPFYDGRNA